MGSRLESNSDAVRKRIQTHEFNDEGGEEYSGSAFGGFPDYFRRKKIKLQNLDVELRARGVDNPSIFRGIVCHVNGYTQPSLNDLHYLIVTHGGGFMQYLDGKTTVTHIIASSLTPKKAVEFKKYRIVKPAWIVDSVKAGKLLPWNDYQVVDEGVGQKVLHFDNGKIGSQVNTKSKGYRDQTESSWYTSQLAKANGQPGTQAANAITGVVDKSSPSVEANHEQTPEKSPEIVRDSGVTKPEIPVSAFTTEDVDDEDKAIKHVNFQEASEATPEQPANELNTSTSVPTLVEDENMTAEEHNAVLLSDPRIRQSSVLNPDFLEQYYRESRLHHLSTWKAELKSQLQALTAEQSSSQKARQKRTPGSRRYVLHVDFDSFFVAISLKNHPEYVEKPACVAHGSGPNSEIASCNYPARKFGIKNGMWMKRALDACKDLKVLPYDFPAYEEASRIFYDAVMSTGGIVQSVSIDEALVDVTHLVIAASGGHGVGIDEGNIWREQNEADALAKKLRDLVKERTGCAISVGIGGNILLAKVALRQAKPAGQYHIKPEEILDFIGRLEVQNLPGVAYSIGGKLEEAGIKFVKDLREFSREKLVGILGPKTGERLWNYARGIDKTEVGEQVVRKSVSAEVNWGVRFETKEQAEEFVESLCGELNRRLLKENVKGKQLTMKIMRRAADAPRMPPKHLGHGKCDTFNKSVALGVATNAKEPLAKEALTILRYYNFSPGELRGLGVQMTKLEQIKESTTSEDTSSQRRLQFKPSHASKDPTTEEVAVHTLPDQNEGGVELSHDHTIEEKTNDDDHIETPKKSKPYISVDEQVAATSGASRSPSKKVLNTTGTQFMLPTQVDPDVLAELPDDIRSKLARTAPPAKAISADRLEHRPFPATVLPNESQIDQETLQALPEDVRAEILAHYAASPGSHLQHALGQALLPQSPRKARAIPPTRKPTRGRPRGGGNLMSRLKSAAGRGGTSTLTQANFVANPVHRAVNTDSDEASGDGADNEAPPDQEFLDALPEDIRREVIAQHRANQLKRTGGIEVSKRGRQRRAQQQAPKAGDELFEIVGGSAAQKERVLVLPPHPPRPTFTTKKLSRIEDLRDAVSLWYEEFRDEGPYREDVEALGKYLQSVVGEENNMGKAMAVVSWMEWLLNNEGLLSSVFENGARTKWVEALEKARMFVQESVKARGLGPVDV